MPESLGDDRRIDSLTFLFSRRYSLSKDAHSQEWPTLKNALPQKSQLEKLGPGDLVVRDYVLKIYLRCVERLSFTERQAVAEVVWRCP